MSSEFTNRVVLVTGAAGNLGQSVARYFANQGALLALADLDPARLQAAASAVSADAFTAAADMGDSASVDQMIRQVEARYGQIHVLAHTVGGYTAGTPVHETPIEVWDRMFALNVRPLHIVGARVAQHMLDQAIGGKMVFVLARAAEAGSANAAAYTASKAAAQRIMQSMALELRDRGINVNGVLPSIIDTPPNRSAMPSADYTKWVTPEDIAQAIGYLASDAARSLYGVSLEVYGRV